MVTSQTCRLVKTMNILVVVPSFTLGTRELEPNLVIAEKETLRQLIIIINILHNTVALIAFSQAMCTATRKFIIASVLCFS